MHIRRKILMGFVAAALPLGTVAALSGAASASKAPPNPVSCTLTSGSVTFSPPLSAAGTEVANSSIDGTATAGGTWNCGAAGNPTFSVVINSKPVKGGKPGKSPAGSAKGTFWDNWCGGFVSSATLKDLKKIKFNVLGGSWKTSSATGGLNGGGEATFSLGGTVSGGTNPTAKKAGTLDVAINPADSANLLGGCTSSAVTTAAFDPANTSASF